MTQLSGNRPLKDQDTRRWLKFFNPTEFEIPPYSTILTYGKMFDGNYTETSLPTAKNKAGRSWQELQSEVGFGNLILLACDVDVTRKFWTSFPSYNSAGKLLHTGATAVAPNSWGLGTDTYPALARVRLGNSTKKFTSNALGYLAWRFHVSPYFDLVCEFNRYGGYTGWSGWAAWGWGWSNIGWNGILGSSFQVLDMVEGYGQTEGLAWVQQSPNSQDSGRWSVGAQSGLHGGSEVVEGDNHFAMFATIEGTSNSGNGVINYDGQWLNFYNPGRYRFELILQFTADATAPAPGENPFYSIFARIEGESKDNLLNRLFYGQADINNAIMLVPAVIRYEHYPLYGVYAGDVRQLFLRQSFAIKRPVGFDPFSEIDINKPLARLRLYIARGGNHRNGIVTMFARGSLDSLRDEIDDQKTIDLTIPGT